MYQYGWRPRGETRWSEPGVRRSRGHIESEQSVSLSATTTFFPRSEARVILVYSMQKLQWYACLSGCIDACADYVVQSRDTAFSEFLWDVISSVEPAREAIEFSPAHIYLSALPYSSRDSLVVRTFSAHLTGLATVSFFGVASHDNRRINTLAIRCTQTVPLSHRLPAITAFKHGMQTPSKRSAL